MRPPPPTPPQTAPETQVSGAVPVPGRPYWLTDAQIDQGIYLGFTRGQWPIAAFSADGTHAAYWAAQDPSNRVVIGPIQIPDDVPVLRGRSIPASTILETATE